MAYRRRTRILLEYLELRDGSHLDGGAGWALTCSGWARLAGSISSASTPIRDGSSRPGAQRPLRSSRVPTLRHCVRGRFLRSGAAHRSPRARRGRPAPSESCGAFCGRAGSSPSRCRTPVPFWWDPIVRLDGPRRRAHSRGPVAGMWSNHRRLYRPGEPADAVAAAGFRWRSGGGYALRGAAHPLPRVRDRQAARRARSPSRRAPPELSDRLRGEENTGGALNPVNAAARCLTQPTA